MHKLMLIGSALLAAGILAGCGGSGGGAPVNPSSQSTTRTLVGFVYVKSVSNTSTSQPQVVLSPAVTPPQGYDDPISGYLNLIVQGGQFMMPPNGTNNSQIYTRDLSAGNDIVVTVATSGTAVITVAGDNIMSNGGPETLVQYNENLSDGFPNGTTHNLNSPGNPDTRKPNKASLSTIKMLAYLSGQANPVEPPAQGAAAIPILAGQAATLAIGYLDAQGIAIPGIPSYGSGVAITSDSPRIGVTPSTNTLTPAFQGQYPGIANITATLTSPVQLASQPVSFSFGYGPPATVTLSMKTTSGLQRIDLAANQANIVLRWNIVTNPRPTNIPSSAILVAQATNKYGAAIPGLQIDWSDPKVYSSGINANQWKTTAGGFAFVDPVTQASLPSSTTDLTGSATVMFQPPNPIDGPLAGLPADLNDQNGSLDQAVKAQQRVVATADGTTVAGVSSRFYITRQIQSLTIAEQPVSKFADVDAYTSVPYTAYAVDVDQWQSLDTFAANWRCTNTSGGIKVGDPGERDLHISPTPVASMSGNNLVCGPTAGGVDIQAYTSLPNGDDDVVSTVYHVNIWGPPDQIVTVFGPAGSNPPRYETNQFQHPNTVPYEVPVSLFDQFEDFLPKPDPPATTTDMVCYFYLDSTDVSGDLWYRNDEVDIPFIGHLFGQTLVIPAGTKEMSVTWASPFGGLGTTVTLPESPTGFYGEQCCVIDIPIGVYPLAENGQVTLEYKGTWYGIADPSLPVPNPGVPFDVIRKIKLLGVAPNSPRPSISVKSTAGGTTGQKPPRPPR